MRKIIIDTDTASDDAVALVAALRDPTLQVLAITAVAGNVELPLAVKNALLSVERAGTYRPPVYVGAPGPLLCELETADQIHGADGM
ncbi:nucleoside hydrolase, partial [Acetanaerobacterium sp. MSJ-12]|uniref:nucleoside hydrolase n=1 Tax=Acetanaerobacterium sp. MSJ-12 TaxID=2841535 RepID=UPI001C0EC315|nr:nucleoside hydrolase [Acetanaerobacterium sp. MSJ-12]